jgi:hypothetical protein
MKTAANLLRKRRRIAIARRARTAHPHQPWTEPPRWNSTAVALAVACTLLVHLLLLKFGPRVLEHTMPVVPATGTPHPGEMLVIQLQPEQQPPRFIEVNPNAPINPPDEAEFFGARDQRAASEEIVEGPEDAPLVRGDSPESQKILPGSIPEELPEETPAPQAPIEAPGIAAQPTPQESNPLPPAVIEGTGIGATPLPPAVQAAPPPGPIPSLPDANRPPAPRPRLMDVLPGEVRPMPGGAQQSGMTAVNARFNDYGEYQRRMWEAIVLEWHRLARGASDSLVFPSELIIRFRINQEGELKDMEVLRSDAGIIGTLVVREAIFSRSPFGPFTEEMRRVLNEEEEFVANFRYVIGGR